VPYGTDSRLDAFQAINCLATIISPFGTTNRQSCPHFRLQTMECWSTAPSRKCTRVSGLEMRHERARECGSSLGHESGVSRRSVSNLVPLQGTSLQTINAGLKPWAKLSCPFRTQTNTPLLQYSIAPPLRAGPSRTRTTTRTRTIERRPSHNFRYITYASV
jgi:hypothetical protein